MTLSASALVELYGVDRRTLTNWLNETPPCPSDKEGRERRFDLAAVVAWREERAVRHARAQWERERPANDEVKEARDRKTLIESRLLELQLEEAEGRVIPLDVHEERVRALCEPLAARLKALSKYVGDVQLATTDVEATALLERIGDEMLATLMSAADEIEEDDADAG